MKCTGCGDTPITVNGVDYVDDALLRDRAITLHGISIERCKCGDSPVLPRVMKRVDLLKGFSGDHAYWQSDSRTWAVRKE